MDRPNNLEQIWVLVNQACLIAASNHEVKDNVWSELHKVRQTIVKEVEEYAQRDKR